MLFQDLYHKIHSVSLQNFSPPFIYIHPLRFLCALKKMRKVFKRQVYLFLQDAS